MKFLTEAPKTVFEQFTDQFQGWWNQILNNLGLYIFNVLQIVLIFIVCKVVLEVISRYTKRKMDKNNAKKADSHTKRSNTLLTLTRSITRYTVYFVGILMILNVVGFGKVLSGLVLTAGVGSLAIGFGAQSLVKDVVTGLFLMFENQFSVGDYIKVNNAEGTVEAIAMRVTYLRTREGSQVIVPNGQISVVENISRGNSVAKVVIGTSYQDDTEYIVSVIKKIVDQYAEENKKLLLDNPSVLAITGFNSSSVDITITCKTKNLKHWQVERELRLVIKKEFDRLNIYMPYQTITLNNENDAKRTTKKK